MNEALNKNVDMNVIIDKIQFSMAGLPQVNCPIVHIFTKGLYTREIFMPSGTCAVSKVHKSQHPFVVSMGTMEVYNVLTKETILVQAPYTGVTNPGARRVFKIINDVILTTFHPFKFIKGTENNLCESDLITLLNTIENILISKRDINKYKTINK